MFEHEKEHVQKLMNEKVILASDFMEIQVEEDNLSKLVQLSKLFFKVQAEQ